MYVYVCTYLLHVGHPGKIEPRRFEAQSGTLTDGHFITILKGS